MSSSTAASKRRKLARSASTIIATASKGYHILKIDGYSHTKAKPTGESIESNTFTVGDHTWYIGYYPNGDDSECSAYISLFLFLNETVPKPLEVQYDFRFIDEVVEEAPPSSLASADIVTFECRNDCSGYPKFIKREDLERSRHLKDDSFIVRCDIAVINKFRVEELANAPTTTSVSLPPPSDLHRHFGYLLQTEKGADVVFQVSGETFKAHRCVLAARSPVFSAELFGQMKESDATAGGVIHIDDMEAHVFKAMLFFVYTDSLPEMGKEDQTAMFQHLLVAADRYHLERLKLICEHKLCRCIKAATLATILPLAEQHHCQGLKKACFSFLSSPANLAAVLASDGFEHLNASCPSVIKELIAKLGT